MLARSLRTLSTPLLLAWACATVCPALADPKPTAGDTKNAPRAIDPSTLAVVRKYCVQCHGGTKPKSDLALDRISGAGSLADHRAAWEAVVENLRSHAMPPEGKPQPTAAEREAAAGWIEAELARLDTQSPRDPGRVTMRRLNRDEYNRTVHDLVGIDLQPADDFPADDVGYGFDNIGDVLSLPPILMEKYLASAEKIAEAAIIAPESYPPEIKRFEAQNLSSTLDRAQLEDGAEVLVTDGELYTELEFARNGNYTFRIRAWGDQAGKEPVRMALRVGDKELGRFDVANDRDQPKMYERVAYLKDGKQKVALRFLNDFYDPDAPNPRARDRNLVIDSLEIIGPPAIDGKHMPSSHYRFVPRAPQASTREAMAREVLTKFAGRAFRRPARPDEIEKLVGLVRLALAQGDSYERGLQLAVQAVLVSPYFLFRVELDPAADPAGKPHRLNDYELASRLSYFLWSSMPDDALFELAAKQKLHDPATLAEQVRRMLKDKKSGALVENFAMQWLQLRGLQTATPDPNRFPQFSDALRYSMLTETEQFFAGVLREDRSVLEFIDADYTFVNERLAKHYGISGVRGSDFRRVTLKDGNRGGVVTQAAVLMATSNPTRTSPVKRGKWILENLLGAPPPPPPPMVPELDEKEKAELSGSLRQRMEQHRADPGCASCHQRMDPLGFGLENFDGIGAWRTKDGAFPVDAGGTLPDGRTFNGPRELKAVLLARKDEFVRCLGEKMLTYALGRGLESYDTPALDRIVSGTVGKQYKFSAMVAEIVLSEPFRMRRGPPGEP